jgi:hypothetical protein
VIRVIRAVIMVIVKIISVFATMDTLEPVVIKESNDEIILFQISINLI